MEWGILAVILTEALMEWGILAVILTEALMEWGILAVILTEALMEWGILAVILTEALMEWGILAVILTEALMEFRGCSWRVWPFDRNKELRMLLEFCDANHLCIANTWSTRADKKKTTYGSRCNESDIDFCITGKVDLKFFLV